MKYTPKLRPAIAMVELVFALVIIGIVLMSAPMVISTANKSGYVALQQEAISAAASEIGMILTYHWDEGNTDENLSTPILATAGDGNLNEFQSSGRRAGTTQQSKRSFLTSLSTRLNTTSVQALGSDASDNALNDDMDDFNGGISNLTNIQDTNTSKGDYVDNTLRISTSVGYISDILSNGNYPGIEIDSIGFNISTTAPLSPNTSNIKRIAINLKTTNTKADISLFAFACNIGTYELAERSK